GFGGLPLLREPTFGPASGLLVSLATGDETYLPEPDRIAKNGQGSDAVFGRSYRSDLARKGYGSPGLSSGWVHNLDLAIIAPAGRWGPIYMVYPNGANDRFLPELSSTGVPTGKFKTIGGIAALITGTPSSEVMGQWQSITVRWRNSLWVFEPQAATLGGKAPANAFTRLSSVPDARGGNLYLLTRLQELRIEWDERRRVRTIRRGSARPDEVDTLLTFDYSPTTGLLTHVTDFGRRRTDYNFKPRPLAAGAKKAEGSIGQPVLASVSQLYLLGTKPAAPNRVGYDYIASPTDGAPLLSTVRVPHPGAAQGSLSVVSASIRYDGNGRDNRDRVGAHVDANGVQHRFTYKPAGTQLDIGDASGNTVSSTAFTIDTLGRLRAVKDVRGGTTSFRYGETEAEHAAVREGALSVVPVFPVAPAPRVAPTVNPAVPAVPERSTAVPGNPTLSRQYTFTPIVEMATPEMPWNTALSGPKPAPAGKVDPNALVSIEGYRLNNAGLVAILGTVLRPGTVAEGGGPVNVILTTNGKKVNRLLTVGGGIPSKPPEGPITQLHGDSAFALGDDGSVVFGAMHEKIRVGMFRSAPGKPIIPVAGQYSVAPIKVSGFNSILVNGVGDICFDGGLMRSDYDKTPFGPVPDAPPWSPPAGMGDSGVYVIHGGQLRNISDAVMAVAPGGDVSTSYYQMNDSGAVLVLWNTTMAFTDRLYLSDAGGVRLVAKSDNTFSNVFPVALSPDGTVTFRATLRGDTKGINTTGSGADPRGVTSGTALFQWRDGQTRKLMDEDSRLIRDRRAVVGPWGELLFMGNRTIMANGARQDQLCLFTGPDPVKDRLLGPGDSLLGAKIIGLQSLSRLNKKGQFAFLTLLDNNKTVLVRADPAGMAPEPSVEGQESLAAPAANKPGVIKRKSTGTPKTKSKKR
ncbi:MAG: hypothetical protein V4671_33045, partial [Armatimonadota bacterium]